MDNRRFPRLSLRAFNRFCCDRLGERTRRDATPDRCTSARTLDWPYGVVLSRRLRDGPLSSAAQRVCQICVALLAHPSVPDGIACRPMNRGRRTMPGAIHWPLVRPEMQWAVPSNSCESRALQGNDKMARSLAPFRRCSESQLFAISAARPLPVRLS